MFFVKLRQMFSMLVQFQHEVTFLEVVVKQNKIHVPKNASFENILSANFTFSAMIST